MKETGRSTLRRWRKRYEEYGFDGLVDWRLPPGVPSMPAEVRGAVCTLRRADPNVGVDVIIEHVREHHNFTTSATKVKRVLREEGLARRPGPPGGANQSGEQHLELGGMKLLEAALEETGYVKALGNAISEHLKGLHQPSRKGPVDSTDRDQFGRFEPSYNDRYRKDESDEIGPGFATVDSKREGLDPTRLHAYGARDDVIERKLLALMTSPLLGNGRWDGIRVSRGELLEELCGFAYMPSTLELFSRELKYAGVSSTLWETHARLWLEQTRQWGDERRAAVLYIDETNKPIWTELFSQSSKVSSVGRVMPALELVCFHSGYGVPLWITTHSGRTPLVNAVPELLTEFQELNDNAEVGRIVVIDAEGNSVPFLKQLEQSEPSRNWVTRFKPSLIEGKQIFDRTRYRPYRDGDRIRMGWVDLNDPELKGAKFRVRVVEVERRSKGTVTYLGASKLLDEREWKAADIADLYFDRWPNQEADFRAVNQALRFKQVHGYGKQLVDNIAVVTELDELDQKVSNTQEQVQQRTEQLQLHQSQLHEQRKVLRRLQQRHKTLTRNLQDSITRGQTLTSKLRKMAQEHKSLTQQVSQVTRAVNRDEKKVARLSSQVERQEQQIEQYQERQQVLDSRRRIFKHDVELDSIFSVLKFGLVLTITFVLKEYFGNAHMAPVTFLERLATLPARLRVLPQKEILTFPYSRRDPEIMALLTKCCDAINARGLRTRSGRTLQLRVEPPPPPARPPPKRPKPKTRFHPT